MLAWGARDSPWLPDIVAHRGRPSLLPIVLTKLRNYEPEKHRAMAGPVDEAAEEYGFISAELEHTERRVIEIASGKLERVPA